MDKFSFVCWTVICGALAVMLTSAAMEFLMTATTPRSLSSSQFRIGVFLASMAVIYATGFILLARMFLSKFFDKRKEEKK